MGVRAAIAVLAVTAYGVSGFSQEQPKMTSVRT